MLRTGLWFEATSAFLCQVGRQSGWSENRRLGGCSLECTLSAHQHLSHPNTIHAKPHVFTGIRNVS